MEIDFLKIVNSIWQVLVIGLLFGARLPALFALGMRALTVGRVSSDGVTMDGRATGPARAAAIACFGLTAAIALFGVVVIVFGKMIFGS